jgi:hypothetical protein
MSSARVDAFTGRVATATAGAAVLANATFAVFSVAGQPWGTINDYCFALSGLAAGALAWRFHGTTGWALAGVAVAGGLVVALGSALVITGRTGWLLAGFVGTIGWGLIGPAIVTASVNLAAAGAISPRLGTLGRWAGWTALLGITATIPAAQRIDDAATAPWWAWLSMIGWLGGAILVPLWAFGIARVARR